MEGDEEILAQISRKRKEAGGREWCVSGVGVWNVCAAREMREVVSLQPKYRTFHYNKESKKKRRDKYKIIIIINKVVIVVI